MNRRQFIKYSLFSAVGAFLLKACKSAQLASEKVLKVTKRKFLKGNNEEISLLGLGCMRLPLIDGTNSIDQDHVQKMVDYAMEHGINYYDTAYFYHNGNSEFSIGKALKKYPRDSFYLADKMPVRAVNSKEDVYRIFDEQLKKCQTDYFDFYLAHNLTAERFETLKKCEVYEILNQKKKEGKIKYLGFSFHDITPVLIDIIKAYDWDFVQLQLNAIDWDMIDAKTFYKTAVDNNLQIIVMNPLKGGQLTMLNDKAKDILLTANPDKSLASWGLRYVASMPNILCVLSGMSNINQLEDNIRTFIDFKPLTQQEQNTYSKAITVYNASGAISCTVCKYCIDCPVGIDIPKIFTIYNQYKVAGQGYKEWVFNVGYNSINPEHRADKCLNCGLCLTKCPQKLNIPELLKEVAKIHKEIGVKL